MPIEIGLQYVSLIRTMLEQNVFLFHPTRVERIEETKRLRRFSCYRHAPRRPYVLMGMLDATQLSQFAH